MTTDQDDSMTFEHFLVPSCLKFFYLYLSPIPNYLKESCSSVILCVCLAISEITDVLLKTKVATLWQYFNLFWALFIHYEEVLHMWFCTSRCCCTFAPMNGHVAGGSCAVFPAVLLCQCIIYRVFHKKFRNFTVSFLRSAACVWYLETNLFFSHTKSWKNFQEPSLLEAMINFSKSRPPYI